MAIALGQRIVVIDVSNTTSTDSQNAQAPSDLPTFHTPVRSSAITAILWISSSVDDSSCIILGTSDGFIQIHSPFTGSLFHRQELQPSVPVVFLHMRWSGTALDHEDLSEDLTIGFPNSFIRIPSYELWSLVKSSMRMHSGFIHAEVFDMKGVGPRTATACLGLVPPSLYSMMNASAMNASAMNASAMNASAQNNKLLVFTAGTDPPIAMFHVPEKNQKGWTISSYFNSVSSSGAGTLIGRIASLNPLHNPTKDRRRNGTALNKEASVWDDDRRKITCTSISPCSRWAACCDSLGRIMIIDILQGLALHMRKGYRDARCSWVGSRLLVHAPRRSTLEVWDNAGRVMKAVTAPKWGMLIVQPQGYQGVRETCSRCWMLDLASFELIEITADVV